MFVPAKTKQYVSWQFQLGFSGPLPGNDYGKQGTHRYSCECVIVNYRNVKQLILRGIYTDTNEFYGM